MGNDIKFIDAEEYQGQQQEKITFKDIIMSHLKKIGLNANVEFRGGYWNRKIIPMQGGIAKESEEYVPDTRAIYSNSIEFMYDLLLPHFDDKMEEAGKTYETDIKNKLEKYMKDGIFTDDEKMSFRQEKLIICRKLFQELNRFLKREDYFKGKTFEEDV